MTSIYSHSEAEARLLCLGMLDAAYAAQASAAGITADSFDTPTHRRIWTAITAAAAADGCTESAAVWRQLTGLAGDSGGLDHSEFFRIAGLEPTGMRLAGLIADVLGLHRQRKLVFALASASEAANANAAGWDDLWEGVEPYLRAAQDAGSGSSQRSLADIATQAAQWRRMPDVRPTTPTPWAGWDRVATPPRAGELIVIAARTGFGKTTLAGNIADDVAKRGENVAVFSLEMSGEELVDRFALRRAGRNGIGNDSHANAVVASSIEEVGRMTTLKIFDDANTIAGIEASCRLLAAAPKGLAAVVIDYLQLVVPPAESKREPREQQVAAMTRRFKQLARAIGCPVFLLAQLNRECEKEHRRPRLSDLRESGSIEQDADRVWFLYRPKTPPDAMAPAEDASEIDVALYQAKCRNGPAGIEAVMRFNRPTFDFRAQ